MSRPLHRPLLLAAACLAIVLSDGLAAQTTVAVPASRDATLYDSPSDLSNGGGAAVFAGTNAQGVTRRAVLAFDVAAALPAGARVLSAELRLNVDRSSDTAPRLLAVHPLLADWGEGTTVAGGNGGNGAPAQNGDATWRHRFYPATLWAAPGGDFAALPSAVADLPLAGPVTIGSNAWLVDDVRAWLDGRRANHGWLLQLADETTISTARRIHSRESATAGTAPLLVIDYLPAGNALEVGASCVGSGGWPLLQTLTGQPVGGDQLTLSLSQGFPGGPALTLVAGGLAADPLGQGPGCPVFLHLEPWPILAFWTLDASGAAGNSYGVPSDPNLFGMSWALQSAGFDPSTARGYVFSNAHLLVFQ